MKRVFNFAELEADEIRALSEYHARSTEDAAAANPRKSQSIFEAWIDDSPIIVKRYVHHALKHQLASLFGSGNADRYQSMASYLIGEGLPVPAPVCLLKAGRGWLPESTLYVMDRAEGEMLYPLLPALREDLPRLKIVAAKVVEIVHRLRAAGVIHRDLNTKNFLVSDQNEVSLIDLDYASRYRSRGPGFARRHERDVQTLIATCHGAVEFAEALKSGLRLDR